MKKVGIITVSRTYNYGAELQAYALQKKLNQMGYKAEIIDYLYFKNSKYKYTSLSKPLFRFSSKQTFKEFVLYRIISPVYDALMPLLVKPLRIKMKNFKSFSNNISNFSKQYRSFEALYKANLDYDVYIAGSDQLWNPATGTSLEPYFLTFAPQNKIKFSYASSFGVSELSEYQKSIYTRLLNNLDYISVRESQGVELARRLTGREITQVLDPTLLLNKMEWETIITEKERKHSEYILIYQLSESEKIVELAYKLKDKLGLPIYRICKRPIFSQKNIDIFNVLDAGPLEFIYYFNNASFVITNSFHGTAFSVNFKVPFYAVLSKKKKNNSRIESFLHMIDLNSRIVYEENIEDPIQTITELDFSNSMKILNEEVNKSVIFLESSINNKLHDNSFN